MCGGKTKNKSDHDNRDMPADCDTSGGVANQKLEESGAVSA